MRGSPSCSCQRRATASVNDTGVSDTRFGDDGGMSRLIAYLYAKHARIGCTYAHHAVDMLVDSDILHEMPRSQDPIVDRREARSDRQNPHRRQTPYREYPLSSIQHFKPLLHLLVAIVGAAFFDVTGQQGVFRLVVDDGKAVGLGICGSGAEEDRRGPGDGERGGMGVG